MKKPLRPCSHIGCSDLTREKYCDQHKKSKTDSSYVYDKYIRNKKSTAFYRSVAWKRARDMVMMINNHLCQSCLRNGVIKSADVVHHIIEIRDDWSKRLDIYNLESLCHSCHNKIHNQATPGV